MKSPKSQLQWPWTQSIRKGQVRGNITFSPSVLDPPTPSARIGTSCQPAVRMSPREEMDYRCFQHLFLDYKYRALTMRMPARPEAGRYEWGVGSGAIATFTYLFVHKCIMSGTFKSGAWSSQSHPWFVVGVAALSLSGCCQNVVRIRASHIRRYFPGPRERTERTFG